MTNRLLFPGYMNIYKFLFYVSFFRSGFAVTRLFFLFLQKMDYYHLRARERQTNSSKHLDLKSTALFTVFCLLNFIIVNHSDSRSLIYKLLGSRLFSGKDGPLKLVILLYIHRYGIIEAVNFPQQSTEYAEISLMDIDQVAKSSFPLCMRHLFEKVSLLHGFQIFYSSLFTYSAPMQCNM